MRRSLVDVLSAMTALAAVAGGLLYATIWWGYAAFYEKLGLTPADVGLTQGDIIRTTGLAACLFAAFTVPAAAAWWLLLGLINWTVDRTRFRGSRDKILKARPSFQLTLMLLALVVTGPIIIRLFLADYIFASSYGRSILTATLALLVAVTFSGIIQKRSWSLTKNSIFIWAGALGIVFACSVYFLRDRGAELAENVIWGRPPYFSQFIFQIQRSPVCLEEGEQRRPAVLLGQSSEGLVLFDPLEQTVLRPSARPSIVIHQPPSLDC